MASVIDSIRTVVTTKHSVLKMIFLAGAFAYPAYRIAFVQFDGWLTLWPILTVFFLLYNVGFIACMVHNEINDNVMLVPGLFNPLKYVAAGIGAVISILPMAALIGFAYYGLNQLGTVKGISTAYTIAVIVLVELLLYAALVTQLLMFAQKFNPLNAFNLILMSRNFTDVLINTIKLIFVLCLFSAIFVIPIGIIVYKMFGLYSLGLLYYFTFVLILYLMIALYFYGQIFMENAAANIEVNYDEFVDNSGFGEQNLNND